MSPCCWSLLTMPSLSIPLIISVLLIINITSLVQAAAVVGPEPFPEQGQPSHIDTANKLNSEDLPTTGESAEDGQYYDDDPSVTFVTDEDIYEDFGGGGLPLSGMSRVQQGHYQSTTGSFALKQKHEDERCPPPQHPPALSTDTRLCRRRKCIKDSDCSSDESIVCCYNGCIHSCQRRVDPPLAFDWLEETELKGLRNSTETTTATSLSPKSLMNAQVTPETIALPGGCFLNAQQYEHLRLFRKHQHVHSCTCSRGDVVCTVNVDKDRIEATAPPSPAIDLQLPVPASASSR